MDEWENAPVTYDLDFHGRIMAFLMATNTGEGRILADELNKRMGVSARKREHDARTLNSRHVPHVHEVAS